MGSFCTSGPQTTNTSQTQTYTPNAQTGAAGSQALSLAQSAASQPFQTPAAPVAPFNPFQQQSFSQVQGLQGGLNPYVNNANASMNTASAPITQADIAANENPYAAQSLAAMKQYVFDPQTVATQGADTASAGGVGAERLALSQANLQNNQASAVGQAESGFYGQALNAAQQSKTQALNSAQGWLGLGLGNQTGQLQATGALGTAGNQQQAQTQAQLMSPYEQTLAQIAYPYQQAQFLAGITGGLSGALGGTTSGSGTQSVYGATPSLLNQIAGGAGIGLAAYGAFGGSGSPAYGGGSALTGDAYGGSSANPAPGLTAADYGAGYAEGGEVENDALHVIPDISMTDTSGQAHNNLNLSPSNTGGGSSSGGGDSSKALMQAASMAMMFMKAGGAVNPWESAKRYAQFRRIPKASGGSVSPWDMGQGYAPGGDVEEVSPDDFNSIDEAANDGRPVDYQEKQFSPHELLDAAKGYYGPMASSIQGAGGALNRALESYGNGPGMYPGSGSGLPITPAAAAGAPAQSPPIALNQNPFNIPANAGTMPMPGAYTRPPPPAIPSPIPQPHAVAQIPQSPDRTGGYGPRSGGMNSDMKISDFEMPKSQQPYPDSLERDAGQTFARSPWMALLQAGAKTAQSTKNGIAGLAEGVQAGAQTLDNQRKELRSEQQINQKAEELYRHAKTELDKYTRKTPHELAQEHHADALLAQGRFQPINYTDPGTGQIRVGNYDAKRGVMIDSMTRQPVEGGVRLLPRGAGLPMTEAQIEAAAKNRFVNEPGKYASIDEAREAVKKQIQTAQTPPGTEPGSAPGNAIPDPGDGNRVSGTWYINPATGKPDRWR